MYVDDDIRSSWYANERWCERIPVPCALDHLLPLLQFDDELKHESERSDAQDRQSR